MAKQDAVIDAQVFNRTASLFAAKREVLAPETVESLAHEIVRRLARAVKQDPRFKAPSTSQESLDAFCDTLVQADAASSLQFVVDRRAEGVTRHSIYLGYIAAASQELGKRWSEDRVSSFDVTIGTGHLYALLRALRIEGDTARPPFDLRKCALFATVPEEGHGLGITIAADIFRDAGWEIDLQIGRTHDDLMAHVETAQPEIIALTLNTEQRLGDLTRLVVAMRLAVPHAIIGVTPGPGLNAKRLGRLVDIDLVFQDANSACADLERLIRLRN